MLILVVNAGSSSVKYQLYDMEHETTLAKGLAERVLLDGGRQAELRHQPTGREAVTIRQAMPDHGTAMGLVLQALVAADGGVVPSLAEIRGAGHRVVHGGEQFSDSVLIDDQVEAAIESCAALAPLHNPPNLAGIRACRALMPGVPQIAVFDTAFHQTLPPHAYLYGLPYELYEQRAWRRYGFHGTSHRYVAARAAEFLAARGIAPAEQRLVICHLGNGCSMAAVRGGRSADTTMGLTPLEGLLMGTRCGDLDPAVVALLCRERDEQEVDDLLNRQSGLLGVSGVSHDMRDVSAAAEAGNARAQAALDLFCYRVRKYIGAYAAALGGLDAVVFTAGIGQHQANVRERCLAGLEFLGLRVDPERNRQTVGPAEPTDISAANAPARALVIPTDEELMIARDVVRLVS